mmetsp:Transcript_1231/g.2800  ORF Transcript_1231/g.2800 Transcript_1231/m.2800 type:complete len:111 (+) Transcript_1231:528-860(+)
MGFEGRPFSSSVGENISSMQSPALSPSSEFERRQQSILKHSFFDENEENSEFRRDCPLTRGLNSPKVKLDASVSAEQEVELDSPEKDTAGDIESLDAKHRLGLIRLCLGG